jgi:hypothetical protein
VCAVFFLAAPLHQGLFSFQFVRILCTLPRHLAPRFSGFYCSLVSTLSPERMSGLISPDKDGRARGISMGLKSASRRQPFAAENESMCVCLNEKMDQLMVKRHFFIAGWQHTRQKNTLSKCARTWSFIRIQFIWVWFWYFWFRGFLKNKLILKFLCSLPQLIKKQLKIFSHHLVTFKICPLDNFAPLPATQSSLHSMPISISSV